MRTIEQRTEEKETERQHGTAIVQPGSVWGRAGEWEYMSLPSEKRRAMTEVRSC